MAARRLAQLKATARSWPMILVDKFTAPERARNVGRHSRVVVGGGSLPTPSSAPACLPHIYAEFARRGISNTSIKGSNAHGLDATRGSLILGDLANAANSGEVGGKAVSRATERAADEHSERRRHHPARKRETSSAGISGALRANLGLTA